MAFSLKTHLVNTALRNGLVLQKTTSESNLEELFKFLRPRRCSQELVRIGSRNDGGYLVPEAIYSLGTIWSAGVADDVNFELDFLNSSADKKAFLIDGSISALPENDLRMSFAPAYLGKSGTFIAEMSLGDWLQMESDPTDSGRILSMDIEGGEYQVFKESDASDFDSFDLIVMELHGLENIYNPTFFEFAIRPMLRKLANFDSVHFHVNNALPGTIGPKSRLTPSLVELTLVHKRTGLALDDWAELPNKLDTENVSNRPPAQDKPWLWLSSGT